MKMKISALVFTILGISLLNSKPSVAQDEPVAPFLEPFKTLQNGKAQFFCREPGQLNGIGGQVARFTLVLTNQEGRFSAEGVETGHFGATGTVRNWLTPSVDFSTAHGKIEQLGRSEFESVRFSAKYDGPTRVGEIGVGRNVSFEIAQDSSSKLVFVRHKDIAILERAKPGCERTEVGCVDVTATIFDNVYLCSHKP
jgi:hypothetical protein